MTIRKFVLSASAAAILSLAPASAFAATQIFSSAINTNGTPFTLGTFDTSLGTLTGVTLAFTVDAHIAVDGYNYAYANAPFTAASTSTTVTINGVGGPISTSVSTSVSNGTLPNYLAENFFYANVSNSSSLAVASSGFAAFESAGAGTIQYSFDTTSLLFHTIGTGANTSGLEFFGGAGSITDGTLAVTYNYMAVPEPATWAMMLAGFGGIGFMLRGSRRKAAVAT